MIRKLTLKKEREHETNEASIAGNVMRDLIAHEDVEAPVEEGQLLGKVVVSKEGTVLGEYPIRAKNAVEKIDFGKGMEILFGTLLGKVEPF